MVYTYALTVTICILIIIINYFIEWKFVVSQLINQKYKIIIYIVITILIYLRVFI